MTTQEQINQHDEIIAALSLKFGKELIPLFDTLFAELANLGTNPTRTQIAILFYPISQYLNNIDLQTVINSNNNLNRDVLGDIANQTISQVSQLKGEVIASMQNELDNEKQSIIDALVLAGIAGATLVPILRELKKTIVKSINRLTSAFDFVVRNFDGAFTLIKATLAGIDSFKYVGGTIATSRQFCINHNNKIMTKKEITDTWRKQSWGGKAPGNPFVVRGGYNCRHFFIPVKGEI